MACALRPLGPPTEATNESNSFSCGSRGLRHTGDAAFGRRPNCARDPSGADHARPPRTRIGALDFKDGAPSKATLDKIYDDIDYAHAQRVFADTMKGVSIHAIRKGLQS